MAARSNVYTFSEIIILVGKLHLKQNSVNKLLATVHGFACPICYNTGYKHHLVTTENQ